MKSIYIVTRELNKIRGDKLHTIFDLDNFLSNMVDVVRLEMKRRGTEFDMTERSIYLVIDELPPGGMETIDILETILIEEMKFPHSVIVVNKYLEVGLDTVLDPKETNHFVCRI